MAATRLAPFDLSGGAPLFEKCPACGVAWQPVVWLLADVAENPDLRARILDGSIHVFRCEACNTQTATNAPILVARDVEGSRLVFSPSPGTMSLDDHNQLVFALGMLREVMEDLWDDSLFSEVEVVARALLPHALSATPTYPVKGLTTALIEADTGWKQQYLLTCVPQLYEPDVAQELDERIARAREEHKWEALWELREQRGLLESCRRVGPERLRALLPAPEVYDPQTSPNDALNKAAGALRAQDLTRAVAHLEQATRELTATNNPLLWAELNMMLFQLTRSTGHAGGSQQHPLEPITRADFQAGPWLARRSQCHLVVAQAMADHALADEQYELAVAGFRALGDERSLAAAYDALGYWRYQYGEGGPADRVEASLVCYQAAANLVDREEDASAWAAMQFNVGNAFLEREKGDALSNATQAVEHLERAAEVQHQLSEDRLQETLGRLRLANLKSFEARLASDPRSADLRQALAALETRDWEGALAAYQSAIAVTEKMLAEEYSEENRREAFGDFGTAYAAAAYICFRLGRLGEGIALLEGGRSRVLSEEMEAFDVDEGLLAPETCEELEKARRVVRMLRTTKVISTKPGADDKRAELVDNMNRTAWLELTAVIAKIKATTPKALRKDIDEQGLLELCPEGGALVLPAFSIAGCAVLVVPGGHTQITAEDLLWLDEFTDNDLIALIGEWNNSQAHAARAERRKGVAAMCERLWSVFCARVAEKLRALGLAEGAPVVVLPQGGLGLLPLSAASSGPEFSGSLLDSYAISYAPSLRLLSMMQRRATKRAGQADSFLAIADPLGDLDFGRAEGTAIAALFEKTQAAVLAGAAASGQNVIGGVRGKRYVHLSCHAFYTTEGGNFSGLQLAHDALTRSNEGLSAAAERRPALEEFFLVGQRWISLELDLSQCRLITLSACESGKTDVGRPDEFLGLPAAFIRAGAAAIIGTAWRVDDAATLLLSRRLYEGLLRDRLSPAQALRAAQRWLRDATNESLARYYGAMQEAGVAIDPSLLQRELRRHTLASARERPFSHPYFWAAFVIYGA
ncbi:CHAT domain-containing protein [Roseateles sp. P5_E4]